MAKINVLGTDYLIFRTKRGTEHLRDSLGATYNTLGRIYVVNEGPIDEQIDTLIHEIIEAAGYRMATFWGMDEQAKEQMIMQLTTAAIQIIKANFPLFWDDLVKLIEAADYVE